MDDALAGTPRSRVDTTLWRIHYCTNAIQIATGPNPNANLIDMVTMVSPGRMAMEANTSERVLGSAIARRDSDTDVHNYRVTLYAARIGETVGLSAVETRTLMKGTLLHDVGNLGIPDNILLKN